MTQVRVTTQLLQVLSQVISVNFTARGRSWTGVGRGSVQVTIPSHDVVTFEESGTWRTPQGIELRFHNVFRWSAVDEDCVRLEHLRFGSDHPVELFCLNWIDDVWKSVCPHLCEADHYVAELHVRSADVRVKWSVEGPKKQETIEYVYSWAEDRIISSKHVV